jgi:glyoxylase-like metal-dependent hydrolase (beta-lactamase superfamily II)
VPGHTAGSIALYDENRKILFSGDTLVYEAGIVHGSPPKLTMCPESVESSCEKLLAIDFDVMLGGHGAPFKPDAAKRIRAMNVI